MLRKLMYCAARMRICLFVVATPGASAIVLAGRPGAKFRQDDRALKIVIQIA